LPILAEKLSRIGDLGGSVFDAIQHFAAGVTECLEAWLAGAPLIRKL
jgi:hypothetical protein